MGFFDFFKPKKQVKVRKRNFFNIQVGDIVTYDDIDYIVQQVLEYVEDGYRWYDYQIVDNDRSLWLGVDDDDGVKLAIYEEVYDLNVDGFPRTVSYKGIEYKRVEMGDAHVVARSDYAGDRVVNVRYADYVSVDGKKYLSLEEWNNEYEASIGYPIKQFQIKILPGLKED
ncbi:DUF4178 domain-containing protein [Caldanaerobius polysaccharolyticus]|uniref:DUF4178 domain-containing protein n=1 Tax=Caldanaerobius polysaccharolyticus TaxID=44256 RepID=UPI00047A388F|nr:DUF4178 domain-containing protein [Caldanaerobius polysaccharolyticus]